MFGLRLKLQALHPRATRAPRAHDRQPQGSRHVYGPYYFDNERGTETDLVASSQVRLGVPLSLLKIAPLPLLLHETGHTPS